MHVRHGGEVREIEVLSITNYNSIKYIDTRIGRILYVTIYITYDEYAI